MMYIVIIGLLLFGGFLYEIVRLSNSPEHKLRKAEKEAELKFAFLRAKNEEWEKHFQVLMRYQAAGQEFEKNGDSENAIIQYNNAVAFGSEHPEYLKINNYYHSIERLLVLYRKKKDYESELTLIENTLRENVSAKDRETLNKRKERVIILKSKKQ